MARAERRTRSKLPAAVVLALLLGVGLFWILRSPRAPDPEPVEVEAAAPAEAVESDPIDGRWVGPGHELAQDYGPRDLVDLEPPLASRAGIRVRAATRRALVALADSARADGVELRVVSGYRSWAYQARLFERAVDEHGADQRWVARPGQSEHQLGTAVDFADAALQHVTEQSFGLTPEGRWLRENGRRFGFVLSFTVENEAETGIRPEPWHLRYVGDPDG